MGAHATKTSDTTSAKKAVEVHKFGGASLNDGAAYRHAVEIIRGRRGPRAVVVSAPAGVTDALLALAARAAAGQEAGLAQDTEALRRRYQGILRDAVANRRPGGKDAAAAIDEAF